MNITFKFFIIVYQLSTLTYPKMKCLNLNIGVFRDLKQNQFSMDLQEVYFSYVHSAGADANTAFD